MIMKRSALNALVLFVAIFSSSCQNTQKELQGRQVQKEPEEPACAVSLSLKLSDSPGPYGRPLAHKDWKIAVGEEPEGLALISDEALLAQGKTDQEGNINMQKHDQERISAVFCEGQKSVWLVYPGTTARINVVRQSAQWSDNEHLFHLLKSQGFFTDVIDYSEALFSSPNGLAELERARSTYEVESNAALLKTLQ